jgi:CheY-like chemotaxis protein
MPELCANCVLLVEDEPSIRNLLSSHLEKGGFQSIHAVDGIDAIVKLRDTLPKVIISDLEMPRMSGIEFIRVVRRRFPTIPVIVLSGLTPDGFPANTGPDLWLEKSDVRFPDVLRAVEELALKTPDYVDPPQVVTPPARTRPGFAGYFMLTCPDCLRTFRAERTLGNKGVKGTAVCPHCEALVPYLMERSEPAPAPTNPRMG